MNRYVIPKNLPRHPQRPGDLRGRQQRCGAHGPGQRGNSRKNDHCFYLYYWYMIGILLVYDWYMIGILLVYDWYMIGI